MRRLKNNFSFGLSRRTIVVVEHNGDGAMNRVAEGVTAFGHRRWPYNLLVTSHVRSDELLPHEPEHPAERPSPTALIEAKRLLVNVPAEVERLESG